MMYKILGLSILSCTLMACQPEASLSAASASAANTAESSAPHAAASDTAAGAATATWDKAYGGADKSYDTNLLKLRDEIAPKFQTLEFPDSVTGKTMTYNLFVPKDYDSSKSYPLVMFMADGSTTGKGAQAPLKQGYGGIIWATDESQAEHPSFVLVPAFAGPENVVNDGFKASDEVDTALRLLEKVVADYSIDKNRLYVTGQSMGGMISFYLNANNPDLFAASLFVGSQWDINVLQPLAKQKFFYIVSAGDPKASKGMKEVGEMLTKDGVKYGETEFSAKLPQAEKEQKIADLIKEGHNINFVEFSKGTVGPAGATDFSEHMYSFDYAYQLKGVRDWLFAQKKN